MFGLVLWVWSWFRAIWISALKAFCWNSIPNVPPYAPETLSTKRLRRISAEMRRNILRTILAGKVEKCSKDWSASSRLRPKLLSQTQTNLSAHFVENAPKNRTEKKTSDKLARL